MKSDSIKVILSTITALGGIGGTYKTMEDRVTELESKMQAQEHYLRIELEVEKLRQEELINEMKHKNTMDSLHFDMKIKRQEYLIKLGRAE
jgi:hypothetical protein